MSVLLILLPLRARETPERTPPAAAEREWTFVHSRDGLSVSSEGRSTASLMPSADRTVALVHEDDVSWIATALPKAPASRLREALSGAIEDDLLEESSQVHLALQPENGGDRRWVAALSKPWLVAELKALAEAGREADALVSLAEPSPTLRLHAREGQSAKGELVCAGPMGVLIVPLDWPGLKDRLQTWGEAQAQWTAEPSAAARLAESLQREAALLNRDQRMLRIAQTGTNLLQFDLAPRLRGSRAVASALREFRGSSWRLARYGLLALLGVQIIGLNVSAFQTGRQTRQIQEQMENLLRSTFPQTRAIVDAPLQMEREVQALMRAAGTPGPRDLESLLDAVALAWPAQGPAAEQVRMDTRGLHITATQVPPQTQQMLALHAESIGWTLRRDANTLSLLRPEGAAR